MTPLSLMTQSTWFLKKSSIEARVRVEEIISTLGSTTGYEEKKGQRPFSSILKARPSQQHQLRTPIAAGVALTPKVAPLGPNKEALRMTGQAKDPSTSHGDASPVSPLHQHDETPKFPLAVCVSLGLTQNNPTAPVSCNPAPSGSGKVLLSPPWLDAQKDRAFVIWLFGLERLCLGHKFLNGFNYFREVNYVENMKKNELAISCLNGEVLKYSINFDVCSVDNERTIEGMPANSEDLCDGAMQLSLHDDNYEIEASDSGELDLCNVAIQVYSCVELFDVYIGTELFESLNATVESSPIAVENDCKEDSFLEGKGRARTVVPILVLCCRESVAGQEQPRPELLLSNEQNSFLDSDNSAVIQVTPDACKPMVAAGNKPLNGITNAPLCGGEPASQRVTFGSVLLHKRGSNAF